MTSWRERNPKLLDTECLSLNIGTCSLQGGVDLPVALKGKKSCDFYKPQRLQELSDRALVKSLGSLLFGITKEIQAFLQLHQIRPTFLRFHNIVYCFISPL
jgi:hypothetical protein